MSAKKTEKKKSKKERRKTAGGESVEYLVPGVQIFTADQLEDLQLIRRPFGIPSLDVQIGGGAPAGSVMVLYGPPGAGKTWLATRMMAKLQEAYLDDFSVMYMTNGRPLDKQFARMHGLRIPYGDGERAAFIAAYRSLHGADPTMEEADRAGDRVGKIDCPVVVDDTCKAPMERLLETVIWGVRSRQYQLVIVDDLGGFPTKHRMIGNLTSGKEERKLEDPHRSFDYASLLTSWSQQVQLALQTHKGRFNPTTVLLISQVRDHMPTHDGGKPFFDMVGGNCLRHTTSAILKIVMKKMANTRIISWTAVRGKAGHSDGLTGEFNFNPYSGTDFSWDLLTVAAQHGLVEQSGSWYSLPDGTRLGQGLENCAVTLDTTPEVRDAIWKMLMDRVCPGVRLR